MSVSGSTCIIDPLTNYYIVAEMDDFTLTPNSTGSCGTYSFYGSYLDNDVLTLRLNNPISTKHFKIRLIIWVFLFD